MINFYNEVPMVYPGASRDFQYLSWLINIVLNSVKHNVDGIYNMPDAKANAKLAELLAVTLGFKVRRNYDLKQLTALVSIIPSILKHKGTERAVEMAGNALIAASGTPGSFEYEFSNHHLEVIIPDKLVDITLFTDILPYILPAGMTCRITRKTLVKPKRPTKTELSFVNKARLMVYPDAPSNVLTLSGGPDTLFEPGVTLPGFTALTKICHWLKFGFWYATGTMEIADITFTDLNGNVVYSLATDTELKDGVYGDAENAEQLPQIDVGSDGMWYIGYYNKSDSTVVEISTGGEVNSGSSYTPKRIISITTSDPQVEGKLVLTNAANRFTPGTVLVISGKYRVPKFEITDDMAALGKAGCVQIAPEAGGPTITTSTNDWQDFKVLFTVGDTGSSRGTYSPAAGILNNSIIPVTNIFAIEG
jgi:hypothetical protein